MRLAVLGSTRGTNLSTLAEAIQRRELDAEIQVVISNKPDALILERARSLNLPAQFMDSSELSREDFDARIGAVLRERKIDLVVLIGYMRILSKTFVRDWHDKIINVHPSLLPAFAGKMDSDVHEAVIAAGMKETGCTVHYVSEEVDAGPILLQKTCAVFKGDTPQTLKQRVQALEGEALVQAIAELMKCRT